MSSVPCLSPAVALLSVVAIFGGAGRSAAEATLLTGERLKETVAGTTVALDTPLGSTLPIVHAADGTLTGNAPGMLASYLGSQTDRGRWWVADGRLCQKWSRWFDAETQCLVIHRDGARVRWQRDDGRSGTGTIVAGPVIAAQAPLPPPSALGGPPALRTEAVAPAAQPSPPTRLAAPPPRVAAMAAPAAPAAARTVAAPPAAASPAARLPITAISYRVARVRADDVLNIRSSASASAPIVATIPPAGRGIRMMGTCIQDWCHVLYGRSRGWVNRLYLDLDTTRT